MMLDGMQLSRLETMAPEEELSVHSGLIAMINVLGSPSLPKPHHATAPAINTVGTVATDVAPTTKQA